MLGLLENSMFVPGLALRCKIEEYTVHTGSCDEHIWCSSLQKPDGSVGRLIDYFSLTLNDLTQNQTLLIKRILLLFRPYFRYAHIWKDAD